MDTTVLHTLETLIKLAQAPQEPRQITSHDWSPWSSFVQRAHSDGLVFIQLLPSRPSPLPLLHNSSSNEAQGENEREYKLSFDETPYALWVAVGCRLPKPVEWACHLSNTCGGFIPRAPCVLFSREIDPASHYECKFSRPDLRRGRPWRIYGTGILSEMLYVERLVPYKLFASDFVFGAIIYYDAAPQPPTNNHEYFLPGEIQCALAILARQWYFQTRLEKEGYKVQQDPKVSQYNARIVNITPTTIRILNASLVPSRDPNSKSTISFQILGTFNLPTENNEASYRQFESTWYEIVDLILAYPLV